jgi:4-methylaminobutanoate oxidase (formaldehyde-forming)
MGPDTTRIAVSLGIEELNNLPFYQHTEIELSGMAIRAANLSYVGEPGWELSCKAADAQKLFSLLRDAGAMPAGAFAQTSMRIEKGFLAYGHDLDTEINPFQAGLEKTIDWQSEFIGKSALSKGKKLPLSSRIVSIVFADRDAVPLGNEPVYLGSSIIGKTTSAAYGYRVDAPLAIALLSPNASHTGVPDRVNVDIAGTKYEGTVITGSALNTG